MYCDYTTNGIRDVEAWAFQCFEGYVLMAKFMSTPACKTGTIFPLENAPAHFSGSFCVVVSPINLWLVGWFKA